ncbi:hypothetical protein GCM10023205_43470 [Yinghuangia aomiensis]|uniref:Protein kinase domain-containing protein n=1 Tax=Yinghuangia aomiensis TaxID=676205 RepID=A0ABP9HJQ6_9ACTN
MRPLTTGGPRHLGGYRLPRRIGAGGMGRVFLARSARSARGRLVAVQVIRPEPADDDEFRARTRFRAEADAALRVDGRWTARLLDAGPEAELPWFATAYLPGPSR